MRLHGGSRRGEESRTHGKSTDQRAFAFSSPAITNTRFYSVKCSIRPATANRPRMISTTNQTTYNQQR